MKHEPAHWSLQALSELSPHALHQLALRASGTLTSYAVHLGRCLLTIQRNDHYLEHGCNSAMHYATSCLGMELRRAREVRRIARKLEPLPLLSRAAEQGNIDFSKLREILYRATPETEAEWLRLAQKLSYARIEILVSRTPNGAAPREQDAEAARPKAHQLRCTFEPEGMALVERGLQLMSHAEGRVVTYSEATLELWAEKVSNLKWGHTDIERALREAELDVAAHECPARDEDWSFSVAADTVAVPDIDQVQIVKRDKPHWENPRLNYNPQARGLTAPQRVDMLRRDGYACQCPGCPNHLWLETHHIVFYRHGGQTVPENLLVLCTGCHKNVHLGHLRILGSRAEGLTFLDRQGRNLAHQVKLERALWVDVNLGWRGGEFDSHFNLARVENSVIFPCSPGVELAHRG